MALSYLFRQSLRIETQRKRRSTVLWFLLACVAALVQPFVCGGWNGRFMAPAVLLSVWMLTLASGLAARKPGERRVYVSSLDERAYLRYGRLFEQLYAEQQKDLLERYRVGTYILTLRKDEDVEARATIRVQAKRDARKILLWAVPLYVLLCLVLRYAQFHGHLQLPAGEWAPILLSGCLAAWVLSDMLAKWREPDDLPSSSYFQNESNLKQSC
ncbi:hypothetical protein [Terriglobus roseus]|uniref:Uncharacterized protein n=1 Tax=Terriglobus roseus TaxID=392734 RepID=A0A1G7PPA2_9BACT|nr:hypothetical protein [Terriglobus roseus]SDF88055.1 hypothetical protein SAMN05444167_3579 [Terriglobus roseus]